jgi:tetratricopeptide (TPR) repeat protein
MEAILSASSLGQKKPARSMRFAAASTMLVVGAFAAISVSSTLRHESARIGHEAQMWARSQLSHESIPLLKRSGIWVRQSMGQALASLSHANQRDVTVAASTPNAVAQSGSEDKASTPVKEDTRGTLATDETGASPAARTDATASAKATELAAIGRALQNDKPVKALELAKALGADGCREPALYRMLSEAASRTRAWGEAHRAAKRLVELEPTAENALRLAQLERRLGHNEAARRTLERLLAKSPNHAEALALLGRIDGTQKVAVR